MTDGTVVSVVKTGVVLQGKGVSAGATVLLSKPVTNDPHCTVILCHAPQSTYHPYVVWTYNELTGGCHTGDYYDNQSEAAVRFAERTW